MSSKTVTKRPDGEIVVDLAEIKDWHGLSPADKAQAIGELLGEGVEIPKGSEPDLDSKHAAKELGLLKPNGTPRDSWYKIAPTLIPFGAYRVGGDWRVPIAALDAFKKNGGTQ